MTEPGKNASRRRFWKLQFGLQTMLVVFFLVSLGLGLFVRYVEPYWREHRVVDEVAVQGGSFETETAQDAWGARFNPGFFVHVTKLRVTGVDDDRMARLCQTARLRSLHLRGSATDVGLVHLGRLATLRSLDLYSPSITDGGISQLAGLKQLEHLNVSKCPVGQRDLGALAGLSQLDYLDLSGTQVTDETLAAIAGLTKLTSLNLSDTALTDQGMRCLGELTKLKTLLINNTAIGDAGVRQLAGLANLETLGVAKTKVTPDSIQVLQKMPKLKSVWTQETEIVAPALAAHWPEMGAIPDMFLDQQQVQFAFVETPLLDAVDSLADSTQLAILVDRYLLAQREVPLQTKITLSGPYTLRDGLKRMLQPCGLTFETRHDYLAIVPLNSERIPSRLTVKRGAIGGPGLVSLLHVPAGIKLARPPGPATGGVLNIGPWGPYVGPWGPLPQSAQIKLVLDGSVDPAIELEFPTARASGRTSVASELELILRNADLHGVLEGDTLRISRQ